jgi:single-strand DNA-binding protein
VDGRLQSRSWDGADGKKQYATEIVAENIQYLDRTKEGTSAEETEELPSEG